MTSPNRHPRKKLYVDSKVQGALVFRVILYWFVYIVTMTLMLLCWRIITGPARPFYTHFDAMWFQYGPAVIASLILLPIVVLDMLRVSNRFSGPMYRLRHSLRALARGEHVKPITFREGDFWLEVAQEFNAIVARVQRYEAQAGPEREEREEGDREEEPVAAAAE